MENIEKVTFYKNYYFIIMN